MFPDSARVLREKYGERIKDLAPDMPVEVCRLADAPTVAPPVNPPKCVAELSDERFALFVSTLIPRKRSFVMASSRRWESGDSTPVAGAWAMVLPPRWKHSSGPQR